MSFNKHFNLRNTSIKIFLDGKELPAEYVFYADEERGFVVMYTNAPGKKYKMIFADMGRPEIASAVFNVLEGNVVVET